MRRFFLPALGLALAAWFLAAPALAQTAEDPVPAAPQALPEIVPEAAPDPAEDLATAPDVEQPSSPDADSPAADVVVQPEPDPEPTPAEAPATAPSAASAHDPFPLPEGLRGPVDFWTNVFGVWSTRQVAFHDISFPALVYEVIDLPGPLGGNYTPEQQRVVREHREAIEARLRHLEAMVGMDAPSPTRKRNWRC